MKTLVRTLSILIAVAQVLDYPIPASAQWSTNPAVNNAICTASGHQTYSRICTDGNEGAIIVWQSAGDIYAQHISGPGYTIWPMNGMVVCSATGDQNTPRVCSDGAGGAVIAWVDSRGGDRDIYAQRVSSSGQVLWTMNGIPVCTAQGDQSEPEMIGDGSGGAMITWTDTYSGLGDIYAQHITSAGNLQWTAAGVPICTAPGTEETPQICADGSGGAVITWHGTTIGAGSGIYAQRVNAAGNVQWTLNGATICSGTPAVDAPLICIDGSGGALISWWDQRTVGQWDIYAQRVTSSGTILWPLNGIAVCNASGTQNFHDMCSDGSGGAIIAWQDERLGGANRDIYAQRISGTGTAHWSTNGISVCSASGTQISTILCADGNGGAIITWRDFRAGNEPDLYAQRIGSSGMSWWAPNGTLVSNATGWQNWQRVCSDGTGGAILSWTDERGADMDIYAARLNASGYHYPVVLRSFAAVAFAETVLLSWSTASEERNYGFELQRCSPSGEWRPRAFIGGHGTTIMRNDYRYTDHITDLPPEIRSLRYRLRQIDVDGQSTLSPIVEVRLPHRTTELSLEVHPTPCDDEANILLMHEDASPVHMYLYDAVGRMVFHTTEPADDLSRVHNIQLRTEEIPSGLYLLVASTDHIVSTRKILVRH